MTGLWTNHIATACLPVGGCAFVGEAELKGTETNMSTPEGTISFDDFIKVKLTVGVVTECKPHDNADKLLVLTVDMDEGKPRTICAGQKKYYQPSDLIGKRLLIVANLEPRQMRGVVSEGMLLAATCKSTGNVQIATVDGPLVAAGSEIK